MVVTHGIDNVNDDQNDPSLTPEIISISVDPPYPEYGQMVNITVQAKDCHHWNLPVAPDSVEIGVFGPIFHSYIFSPDGISENKMNMRWIGGNNYSAIIGPIKKDTFLDSYIVAYGAPYLEIPGDISSFNFKEARSEFFVIHQKRDFYEKRNLTINDVKFALDHPETNDLTITFNIPDSIDFIDLLIVHHHKEGMYYSGGSGSLTDNGNGHYSKCIYDYDKGNSSDFEFFVIGYSNENIIYHSDTIYWDLERNC